MLLCITVSGYQIIGDTVIYDSIYANLSVRPHTTTNPLYTPQTFTVSSKDYAGDLCAAYVFDQALVSSNVEFWKNISHQYQSCEEDENQNLINCETAYAYYPDWKNVNSEFAHVTQNDKHTYYTVNPLHFDEYETKQWQIRYNPPTSSGKWDLWLFNSQTGDCLDDYINEDYNFLYKLDPWWNSTNTTQGYVQLSNQTFTDRFEDYSYQYHESFDSVTDFTVLTSTITTSANRIEGAKSLEVTLTAPNTVGYAQRFYSTPTDCSNADTIAFWFKPENQSNPGVTDNRTGHVYLGQDTTDYYRYDFTNNSVYLKGSGNWAYFPIPKSSWIVGGGAPDWALLNWTRVFIYGKAGSTPKVYYDHIYCYNSSDYFNTTRWNVMNGSWELQSTVDNGFGVNTTKLSFYDRDSEYYTLNLTNFTYKNYEIIFNAEWLQDFGSNQIFFTTNGKRTNNSVALFGTTMRVYDDVGGTVDDGVPIALNQIVTVKYVVNNSFISVYRSDNFGLTFNLVYNYTSLIKTDNVQFIVRQAQTVIDNILIRELIPTTYNSSVSLTPSFIYDDSEGLSWVNATYTWFKDGVLQFTDVITSPTDFNNSYFRLLNEGSWYANVAVCNSENCSSNTTQTITVGIGTLSVTIYDEQTRGTITTNVTIDVIGSGYSSNFTIDTGSGSINIPAGDYELRYSGEGYDPRSYFLTILSDISNDVALYLLNSSDSDRVIHTLFDQSGIMAENIIIQLQRNYVSNLSSVYTTVSMTKTNFQGQAVLYVELYDVWYRMMYFTANGSLLKITDPSPFFATDTDDRVNTLEDIYFSWRTYDGNYYNVSFLNQTGTIYARYIFIDSNNLIRNGCLRVQRITPGEWVDVCNNCTSAASATLSCIIDHTLPGQYKAVGTIDTNTTNSYYTVQTVFYGIFDPVLYGQEGIFFGVILVGSMALMGIATVTGSILLLLMGIIALSAVGIFSGMSLVYIYYLVILGFIVLFMITKSGRQ